MESLISARKIRMDSQFLLNPTFIHRAFLILFDVNFQNIIVYNQYSNISSISPSKIKFKCFYDTSYQKESPLFLAIRVTTIKYMGWPCKEHQAEGTGRSRNLAPVCSQS